MADSEPIRAAEADGVVTWSQFTDADDVRRVHVSFDPDANWQFEIFIPVAEFIRDEPLESEFRARIDRAIRISGIADVAEEDRELWLARGQADGAAIARSVAAALDAISVELNAALDLED